MAPVIATFTRLHGGGWGVRIAGFGPPPGTSVLVTRKGANPTRVTVRECVYQGPGFAFCSIHRPAAGRRVAAPPPYTGRRCAACGRPGHLQPDLFDGALKHADCCDVPA